MESPIRTFIFYLKDFMIFGYKELWRPPTANRESYDYKDVVFSNHNKLSRPWLLNTVCDINKMIKSL